MCGVPDSNPKEVGAARDDQPVLQHHQDVAGASLKRDGGPLLPQLPHINDTEGSD